MGIRVSTHLGDIVAIENRLEVSYRFLTTRHGSRPCYAAHFWRVTLTNPCPRSDRSDSKEVIYTRLWLESAFHSSHLSTPNTFRHSTQSFMPFGTAFASVAAAPHIGDNVSQ